MPNGAVPNGAVLPGCRRVVCAVPSASVTHAVPELAPEAVEKALSWLGYIEPDLDVDLPEDPEQRVRSLLKVALAVVEAHLRERDCLLDEEYFAVTDHLAETDCRCSFLTGAAVPLPRSPAETETEAAENICG